MCAERPQHAFLGRTAPMVLLHAILGGVPPARKVLKMIVVIVNNNHHYRLCAQSGENDLPPPVKVKERRGVDVSLHLRMLNNPIALACLASLLYGWASGDYSLSHSVIQALVTVAQHTISSW
jgi:hypothetical protein